MGKKVEANASSASFKESGQAALADESHVRKVGTKGEVKGSRHGRGSLIDALALQQGLQCVECKAM